MRSGSRRLVFLAVFTVAIGAWLFARHDRLEELRREAARLRPAAGTLSALQEANARLAATRVPAKELESLRADHAAIARLRNQIEAVKRSLDAPPRPAAAASGLAAPTLLDGPLSPQQWRNAGRETPAATVETMLWAAAGGDIAAMADTLELSPEARRKAEALRTLLSAESPAGISNPDQLVALMAAMDMPTGSAQVVAEVPQPEGTLLVASVADIYGHHRAVALSLRTDGNGWRIVVPPSAVDRFAARLDERADALHLQPREVP